MDYERAFRRVRNVGRQRRREERLGPEAVEPESPSDPVVELAEICAELHYAIGIIGQGMPRVERILNPLSERINKLR